MAVELGTAYLSIGASTDGLAKDIRKEFNGVEGQAKTSGGKIGGFLGKGMKAGVIGVAAVGTAVAGLAAKGGISRALNIEDAQAKLKGLGHDTKAIDTIMTNALASVKGTAFGLGDAATAAAGAVAAGVKPGQDLERTLKLIGDSATIAGVGFNEMGSIFNKVASSNKIQGDVIAQLSDAGIPIVQLLGKELGKTAEETTKMASKGAIDFATFQKAMESGLGGAALESGSTFRGALANVYAALGRLGETAALPFLELLKDGFNAAIPVIDQVNGFLKPVMATLGEKIGSGLPGFMDQLRGAFDKVLPVVQPFIDAFSNIAGAFAPLLPQIMQLVTSLSPLSMIFQALAPVLPTLAATLTQVGTVLAGIIGTALTAITPLIQQFTTLLGETLIQIMPAVQQALTAVGGVLQTLAPAVGLIVGVVADLVGQLLGALMPVLGQLISAVLPVAVQVLGLVAKAVVPVVQALIGILKPAIDALMPVVKNVFNFISRTVQNAMQVISGVIKTVTSVIKGDWSGAWDGIKQIASAVWDQIKNIVVSAFKVIGGLFTAGVKGLLTVWLGGWNALGQILGKAWDGFVAGVKAGFSKFNAFFGGIPAKLLKVFVNAPSLLTNAGKNVIKGFLDGITNGFQSVKNKLTELTNLLPDWKGPSKKDKRILTPAGKKVMDGFVRGLESGFPEVKASLSDFTKDVVKFQEDSIKAETKRIQEARRVQNQRVAAFNKKLAVQRDKKLAAADKISDSKRKAAEKKRVREWYKAQKRSPAAAMTADQARRQAKKNLGINKAQMAAAKKAIKAQQKQTVSLWDDGKYRGAVSRWQGFNLGTARLLTDLSNAGNFKKAARALTRKATLADVGRAQTEVNRSLEVAQATLKSMRDARDQLRSQVASSIRGELDLSAGIGQDTVSATGHTIKGKTTFKSVASTVASMAGKAKKFAQVLARMAKAGIPAGLIQEVASLGTEKGIPVGEALASGSKTQVKNLAADYSAINKWSDQAGISVSAAMYETGIYAQEGLIRGLQADSKKLDAAAKKLAEKLTKAVKKQLGIKSPSRVFRDEIGAQVVAGLRVGLENDAPAVKAAEDVAVGIQRPFDGVNANSWSASKSALVAVDDAPGRAFTDEDIRALVDAMAHVVLRPKLAVGEREAASLVQYGQSVMERIK